MGTTRRAPQGALLILAFALACDGSIGGTNEPGPGPGPGPGPIVPPICEGAACLEVPEIPVTETRIPRLNHAQWESTVRDLFRMADHPDMARDFDRDNVANDSEFTTTYRRLIMSEGLWQDYQRAAETLATEMTSAENVGRWIPGGSAPADAAGRDRYIREFGLRAFRRPLTDTEVARYAELYDSGAGRYGSVDAATSGVRVTLEAMLQSPHFVYRVDLSDRDAGVAKAADDQPVFTMFFKQGNGVQQARGSEPERFWPSAHGAITREILTGRDSGRAVSELADFADQLCIVSGMDMPFGGGSCGHARGLAQLLTAAPWLVGDRHARASHESIDWFIANNCNPDGAAPLHFAAGQVEGNYVSGTLSYRGNNDPYPAQNNPYAAYVDLFGGGTPEIEDQVAVRRRSVNDLVRTELTELMGSAQLGSVDRQRLRDHLEFIRDIEVRMCDALPPETVSRMEEVRDSLTANDIREEIMMLFMDITAVAFACNVNRAAVLQMGAGNDSTRYYIDGTRQNSYHRISHRVDSDGSDGPPIPNADILHHEIDRIHARMFRHFLESLSAYSGPSGDTILYDTTAVWTNDLSNGPPHSLNNMPFVMAGSSGGFLRTGIFADAGGTTHNRLFNTLISAHGITNDSGGYYDSFGDDSLERGVLDQIIAG